ncbi:nitrous oxide reductase accessory protein NosL [Flexithrix dorotheae]|uniref:nitrous oxide reductase accessory protein NosL n=1 Tax=Flexithrix dorotheae TaxID=70993 RepID=UPI0003808BCA|nr:nitrous oxide reductase accessory protein NosL [Flexithrix dorotheae]
MKTFAILIVSIILIGCSAEPEPIRYGQDACHYCKMKIVDNRYGAELVTQKGKIYKFDAVECLIHFYKEEESIKQQTKYLLATSFNAPGTLQNIEGMNFLRTKALPSPMGMFLTAFSNTVTANEFKDNHGGDVYTWESLMENFHQFSDSLLSDANSEDR